MLEYSPLPCDGPGTVTAFTIGGIPGLLVVGIGGIIVVIDMAARAFGRSAEIYAVLMTGGTGGGEMVSFQLEPGMLKYGTLPGKGFNPVTGGTVGGKPRVFMIGFFGVVVVSHVTGCAVGRKTGIDSSAVAFGAARCFMYAPQYKGRMIEGGPSPCDHAVMTNFTVGGEPGGLMVRVSRFAVFLPVTGKTVVGLTG